MSGNQAKHDANVIVRLTKDVEKEPNLMLLVPNEATLATRRTCA